MAPNEPTSWPSQAADTVERLVATVRDKTTGPLLKVVRAIVFGFVALVLGLVAFTILAIAAVRLLTLIPGGVWVGYLIAGGVFLLVGFGFWSRRTKEPA
jgi:vacuolar-type H+-ATPase subunit I/STV1